eukprot:5005906-Amphidinium_carterae.1
MLVGQKVRSIGTLGRSIPRIGRATVSKNGSKLRVRPTSSIQTNSAELRLSCDSDSCPSGLKAMTGHRLLTSCGSEKLKVGRDDVAATCNQSRSIVLRVVIDSETRNDRSG